MHSLYKGLLQDSDRLYYGLRLYVFKAKENNLKLKYILMQFKIKLRLQGEKNKAKWIYIFSWSAGDHELFKVWAYEFHHCLVEYGYIKARHQCVRRLCE